MTFWAKLLTVFVLILSVIFAAVSTVLFATKTEWRQAYDMAREDHRSEVQRLQSTISDLEGRVNLAENRAEEQADRAAQLQRDKDSLETTVAELETRRTEQTRTVERLATQLETLQQKEKEWEPRLESMRASLEERTEQLRDETARLQEMTRENEKLATANRNLTEDLTGARAELNEVSETLTAKERILADLGQVYPDIRDYVDAYGEFPTKRIQAKVVAVDNDANMVVINKGAEDGVRREYQFTVFSGNQFKGLIRIFELEGESLAAGRIEMLATDDDGRPQQIEIGDDVKTGIGF